MKALDICCIFIVFSLLTVVKTEEPEDGRQYDDNNIVFDAKRFKEIFDLARNPNPPHNQYVPPYNESDYAKLSQSPVPNRYKQKFIDNFDKLRDEIGMKAKNAAFEAVRIATEDMMDLYLGRLYSERDMNQFMEIRRTDPVRFLAYMGQHDQHWFKVNAHKEPGKGDKPTYKLFRELVKKYYIANPTTKSRLIEI